MKEHNALTVRDLLDQAKQLFTDSESPQLDAELILASVFNINRTTLVTMSRDQIEKEVQKKFFELCERRQKGESVAYILGRKEFYGLEYAVGEGVLVPRPETELLVELCLERTQQFNYDPYIVDAGTGSGCIATSIAVELQKQERSAKIIALDCSAEALQYAEKNVIVHKVKDRIQLLESNWFDALPEEVFGNIDIIVSNPPYIDRSEKGKHSTILAEPDLALYADENGLKEIFYLIKNAPLLLKDDGLLLCEIGSEQEPAIRSLLDQLGFPPDAYHFYKDLAGRFRVLELSKAAFGR